MFRTLTPKRKLYNESENLLRFPVFFSKETFQNRNLIFMFCRLMSDTDNTETDSVRFKFLALSCYGDFFRRPKPEIRYVKIFNSKNVWISLHFPCYSAPSPISVIVIVTQKKCNKDRHKQVWPSRPISCPRTKRFLQSQPIATIFMNRNGILIA